MRYEKNNTHIHQIMNPGYKITLFYFIITRMYLLYIEFLHKINT